MRADVGNPDAWARSMGSDPVQCTGISISCDICDGSTPPFTSTSAHVRQKASRLLLMGRVRITCSTNGVEAIVQGDTGRWRLFRESDRWRCTCASWAPCSHALAVQLVTER
jgi:hypothetical protein